MRPIALPSPLVSLLAAPAAAQANLTDMRSGRLAILLALSAALLAPTWSLAAWTHDPVANLPVCTLPSSQDGYQIASDGAGGAIVTWSELRGANQDVFAARVLVSGSLAPSWPANGVVVCSAAGDQGSPALLPDGAGGAIIVWSDGRPFGLGGIYAQHVLASGVVDPTWPVDGRGMVVGSGLGGAPRVVSDGANGVIAVWMDFRNGNLDIFTQHLLASGVVDPSWPATGRALCTATGHQWYPQIVTDMAGGAIVTWEDQRSGVADVYAMRVLASGALDPAWPVNGRAICTAGAAQPQPQICSDGAGGAIVTWEDPRLGVADIYAQRVLASGAVDPAWPVDGRVLCNFAAAQTAPLIQADGSGGGLVIWNDARNGGGVRDLYATRVLSYGLTHPSWPVNGLAVATAPGSQNRSSLVPDGANGAIVLWYGADGAAPDILAQHLKISGVVDPLWPASGSVLCSAPNNQFLPLATTDGVGGAIVVWSDSRAGNNDLYAQRVARSGEIGTPEPVIVGVQDIPNDQGGRVKLSWDASYLDFETSPAQVDNYRIYRSVPPGSAAESAPSVAVANSVPTRETAFLAELAVATGLAWEFLTTISAENASFITGYSYVASTLGDSTGASNPTTAFLVAGFNAGGDRYWYSEPMSGYSVDNLSPAAPMLLTGNYAGAATHLHWVPNVESDLATYRIYRGSSPSFVPGSGNLIASPPDTGYVDPGTAGGYYKVSAVDAHGNESGFALLGPGNTTAVELPEVLTITLAPPHPNPAVRLSTVGFALPRETRVRLVLYDLSGRQVKSLVDRVVPAGRHVATWDLGNDRGEQVANGIYFIRMEAGGRQWSRRLAVSR